MSRLAAIAALGLTVAGCGSAERAEPSPAGSPAASSSAGASPTATPCSVTGASMHGAAEAGSGKQALLTDVRYTATGCPRVVFEFENTAPVSYTVEYRDPPFSNCGSGARVDTSGWGSSAYLVFHSNQASGVDLTGPAFRQTYKKSKDIAVSSRVLRRVHQTCDFEGVLEWVIALDARHAFKASTLAGPPRLVIDISQAPA